MPQPLPPPDAWQQGGGDLGAAIEALASAHRAGALLQVQPERRSLEKARSKGLAKDQEGRLLRGAWKVALGALAPGCVGRRTGWSTFGFVLAGTRGELETMGTQLVGMLLCDEDLGQWAWHVVLTEVFASEPERTLHCDPGYALAKATGKSAVAWVQPYSGADWREPQRYPTVSLAVVEATSGR
ncbi:MAG TPA: hypothetical protein VGK67_29835 [Myxococcales bacterium]|jgi:hypothetical protein